MGEIGDIYTPNLDELRPLDRESLRAAIAGIPPLPDEDDPIWNDETTNEPWMQLGRLIVAADLIGEHGWREEVPILFERACLGNPADQMQGIRHGTEKAYKDDVHAFVALLLPLARHERPGTRQWVARELGILRDLNALPALVDLAIEDGVELVRGEARLAISMLAQVHLEAAAVDEVLP